MNELELFAAAVAIADPAERESLLDRECAGRPDVRQRIERLLDAHFRSHPSLDRPVLEATGAHVPNEQPGIVIASRYKLLEEIGEGGMGTVWVAEQTQPVRRKVALKLIKAGMDSRSVIARFEAERQALAVMDHPNVAKVLDGGLTETGRPFFVMEYVKGVPITEYCDASRLSVPDRLQLFTQVCQAVQHAHQKGIIHRDLKPSNILVAPYDDKPVPKIIDFGLAKAMHQSLTEKTLYTAHESVLGTPLYMSPEQAQLNNFDVDTRSDIYSLGVLLYELLTGTTPLEKQRFKEAAWDEVRRIIREEEPPRPSARLSSTNTLPSLAACRQTEPLQLAKQVRGELDWIVMKALEKDRTRRYETANGLARDIQRYLADEVVEARPPSSGYRLKKFVRRYKAQVFAASLVVIALLAGSAGTTWGLIHAERQRQIAELARSNEAEQRAEAQANFQKARGAVDEYFTRVSESKLLNVPGLQPLRKELLESSRKYYQEFLKDHSGDPSVRAEAAEAWYRVGFVTMHVDSAKEAIEFFQRATEMYEQLALDHPTVERYAYKLAMCLNDLGNQQADLGREPEARRSHERCLAIREQVVRDHPDVPEYLKELGIGYGVWAQRQHSAGLISEALRLHGRERDIFERLVQEHPNVADYQSRLAGALRDIAVRQGELGHSAEALRIHQQAHVIAERLVRDHPDVVDYRTNLAHSHGQIGWNHYRLSDKNEEARTAYLKALDVAEAISRDNPGLESAKEAVAYFEHQLGRVLVSLRKLDEALEHFKKAFKYFKSREQKSPGGVLDHQLEIGYLCYEMGKIHLSSGRPQEASAVLDRAQRIFEAIADSNALEPYNRACALAICADLVGLGKTEQLPDDQARRRKFTERAIAILGEALALGHHSPDMIGSDVDFEAIRSNDDFKALIAGLKAQQQSHAPR